MAPGPACGVGCAAQSPSFAGAYDEAPSGPRFDHRRRGADRRLRRRHDLFRPSRRLASAACPPACGGDDLDSGQRTPGAGVAPARTSAAEARPHPHAPSPLPRPGGLPFAAAAALRRADATARGAIRLSCAAHVRTTRRGLSEPLLASRMARSRLARAALARSGMALSSAVGVRPSPGLRPRLAGLVTGPSIHSARVHGALTTIIRLGREYVLAAGGDVDENPDRPGQRSRCARLSGNARLGQVLRLLRAPPRPSPDAHLPRRARPDRLRAASGPASAASAGGLPTLSRVPPISRLSALPALSPLSVLRAAVLGSAPVLRTQDSAMAMAQGSAPTVGGSREPDV